MTILCGAINVKDSPYNATGNGTTNDRDAIQSAIDAAGISWGGNNLRKQVCIPAGRYRCDSGLTIPYGLSLVGHPGGTVLDFANAASSVVAIQWGTSAQDVSHGIVEGLTLYGPGTSTGSIGIMAGDASSTGTKKVSDSALRYCVIRDFGTGIKLGSNCYVIQFERLRLATNGRGIDASGTRTEFGENLLFDFCSFDDNTQHLRINATGGQGAAFRSCVFSYANQPPEAEIGAGTTILLDKCTWDSDLAGTSGSPLLVDIAFRVATIVFRDTLFRLSSPAGIPVCWNSSEAPPGPCRVSFDSCRVTGASSGYFYGTTSLGAASQPVALAIQSPDVTAASGKIDRIDP